VITIRPARAGDQEAIAALVRAARLNPAGLDWPGFMVAERDRRVVGVAQLRRHPDGAVELASLVVAADLRGQGTATRLIDALLETATGTVFTLIDRAYAGHFGRWGFAVVRPADLPRSVRRTYRIGRVVTALASIPARRAIRIVAMRRG
jgi:N-acetylglutamate synthase-like GNAT family acetyltransferase